MARPWIFASIGALVAAYLAGRYSAPEKVIEKVKTVTVEVERKSEQKTEDKVQKRVESYRKDGTLRLVRVITGTKRETNLVTAKDSHTTHHTQREVENTRGVSLALIGGLPLAEIARGPAIGGAASIPIGGPFFIGPVFIAPPMLFLGMQGGFTF